MTSPVLNGSAGLRVVSVMKNLGVGLVALALVVPLLRPVAASAPGEGLDSTTGSIIAGGLVRTFRVYVPLSHNRTRPAPLLIALHGGGGTGTAMERLTIGGLNRLAARDGFVVVYPDGVERHWNDGRGIAEYRAERKHRRRGLHLGPHRSSGAELWDR